MPANDREVFEYLRADQDTPIEIDLLAYAIFAHEKQQWLELFEKQKGRRPTQEEVDDWIAQITDWRFGQMREEAIQFFDTAARTYLADEMEAARKDVFQDTVIREVKAAGGFWRQLAMQVITAILAPLLIGLVIAAALLYDRGGPTISGIADRIQPQKTPASTPSSN